MLYRKLSSTALTLACKCLYKQFSGSTQLARQYTVYGDCNRASLAMWNTKWVVLIGTCSSSSFSLEILVYKLCQSFCTILSICFVCTAVVKAALEILGSNCTCLD